MKYLRKFETEAELSAWRGSSEYAKPNVVLADGVIRYNLPKLGAYIQHIDGTLYDEEGWTNGGFSNDEANGIAVITTKASFVIAKTDLGEIEWISDVYRSVGGMLTADKATALADFAGYDNTQSFLASGLSGACYSCANYTFPNGNKGYLPALGELSEATTIKSKIDSLMTKIGGTELKYKDYWSSTQYSQYNAWICQFGYSGSSVAAYVAKNYDYYVRPFTALAL